MKSFLTPALLAFAIASPLAVCAQEAGPGNLQGATIEYNLIAKGINVGTGTYSYNFSGNGYRATATHRLTGLAR